MKNLFLTGEKRIGKSTIIRKITKKVDHSLGGYITERKIEDNIKTFTINSLYDVTEKHIIANIDIKNNSKDIIIDSFEKKLPLILDNSLKYRDLIVLDELGFMENHIETFTSKVYELLDSEKPVFGVLKDFDCEFLNKIRNRNDVIILEITKENRDNILDEIVDILKSFGVDFRKTYGT